MTNKTWQEERQEALEQHAQDSEAMEQAWEEDKESYIPSRLPDLQEKESHELDTNTTIRDSFYEHPDPHFEDIEANWNDNISDSDEMDRKCVKIMDKIFWIHGTTKQWDVSKLNRSPDLLLRDLGTLLNRCFSERIKIAIVEMVADDETVEGACKHIFNVYDVDNKTFDDDVHQSMCIWYYLKNNLGEVYVYNAFLERSWHLNPTSQFFPSRYNEIVEAVRSQREDRRNRNRAKYANPYEMLSSLNETYKKLTYTLRHEPDAAKIAKLANSIVRVSGAMYTINNRLEEKHREAIESEKRKALYTKIGTQHEEIIDTEELPNQIPENNE